MEPSPKPEPHRPAVIQPSENAVLLPCEPEQFRDFISGLLGQPQVIGRNLKLTFDVNRDQLVNLHHLVMQRILAQNDATLMGFSVRILYGDGSSVILNSIEDLTTYSEVRPLVSVGAVMQWTLLVHFRGREIPEKQEISISFSTEAHYKQMFSDDSDEAVSIFSFSYPSTIGIRISHTDRSWGTDLESLITKHIEGFEVKIPKTHIILRKYSTFISMVCGAMLALSLAAGASRYASSENALAFAAAQRAWTKLPHDGTPSIALKLDYLTELFRNRGSFMSLMSGPAVIISIVAMSVLFAIFLQPRLAPKRPSFVLLTKQSEDEKTISLEKLKRSWISLAIYLIFAVFIGVLGNYAYAIVSKFF